jgi:cold shock CspA family protein
MNSFLLGASKFAVSSLHSNRAAPANRLVALRCFSSGDDEEVKTGVIQYFSYKTQFGFILPDGIDKGTHKDKDLIFIHRNDIKVHENAGKEKYYPGLKRNLRVAFKVSPPDEGKESSKAYDLTLEDGNLVPPFQKGYLERYTKTQKAQFGDKIFEISE